MASISTRVMGGGAVGPTGVVVVVVVVVVPHEYAVCPSGRAALLGGIQLKLVCPRGVIRYLL